ncbi:lycopene cyclase domain-containing protein [Kribbella deserti]|uniref:Lycopene cyclase domain-containing protein n=1 Tax=Kribbella deserti TaxID=1926257 RepID=A0ABV6QS55_9ACTN
MDRWHYLLVLAACVLITLPLELAGARVYRRPRRWLLALAPAVAVLLVWDIVAIAAGIWSYNPRYLLGITLPFQVPLEELLFFLVVPTCGLLTYEAVQVMLERVRRFRAARASGDRS